jgi:hypothetical protein
MPEDVDDALRTLRDALAREPSAGFEARVREQLAGRRAPDRRSQVAWILAAAAVLAALVVVLRAPRGAAPVRVVDTLVPRPVAPEPTVVPHPVPVVRTANALVRARPRPIVPPDGMARLARYVSSVRAHPLDPDLLARDASAPLAEPHALEVRAIEITPLESMEGSPE